MIERFFHITCDDCGLKVIQHRFGRPDNFQYIMEPFKSLRHLCGDCAKNCNPKFFLDDNGKLPPKLPPKN